MLLCYTEQVANNSKGSYSFPDSFEVIARARQPDTTYLLNIIGHRHELDVACLEISFRRNEVVEVVIEEIADSDTVFTNDRLVIEIFTKYI